MWGIEDVLEREGENMGGVESGVGVAGEGGKGELARNRRGSLTLHIRVW